MSSMQDKRAIVTGASRGIGRAIAEAYADAGADVAILARNEELLAEVAAAIEAKGRKAVVGTADVLDADAFRATLREAADALGGVDVLVNNAGGNSFSTPLVQTRYSGWEKTIKLNLDSVVHACQELLPDMIEQGSGSVINLSSIAGLRSSPFMAHYGAAKAAVVSLTQTLAVESASRGVRVNTLLPGWIDTDLTEFLRDGGQTEEMVLSRVPMHRWGWPEEIAKAAIFLGSDDSSFMTGQSLIVDGGLAANM